MGWRGVFGGITHTLAPRRDWFWTGALRGRSPCTREGRRPDRQETSSEEWENIFARLIQGCNAVAAGQLPLNQGSNGAKDMQMPAGGARHPEASKQREPCRCQASERIIQCLLHPKQQCYNHVLSGQVRPVYRCCKFDFFDCNGGQPLASKQHKRAVVNALPLPYMSAICE